MLIKIKKRHIRSGLLAVVLLALGLTAAFHYHNKLSLFRKSSEAMHTYVTITVAAKNAQEADDAIEAAVDEIRSLETLLSFWNSSSEISLINHRAGDAPVMVSSETMEVIEYSLKIAEITRGAFDPTIGPLIRQWDFRDAKIPSPRDIDAALALVDYKAMEAHRQSSTAFLTVKGMSFDTGGIAKGYAADVAVRKLKEHGISAGLVAVAGDIRAFGRKPDGSLWRVGIRDPRADDPDEVIATLPLLNEAVSTSGDYERFFIVNGVRFHHIIDPSTGHPANRSMSATVIAREAVLTDGLSTGVFVMGPAEGIPMLDNNRIEGLIIDAGGKTHLTKGIANRLVWTRGTVYRPAQ